MSEERVQTREELVAKRDEIIDQLQGEWETRLNWRVIIRRSSKWARGAFLIMFVLMMLIGTIVFMTYWLLGVLDFQHSTGTVVLFIFICCAVASLLGFVCSIDSFIRQQRWKSLTVAGNEIDWGEGERTDLRKLYSNMDNPNDNESYLEGQVLLRVLNAEQWGFLAANCVEPVLIPSQFVRGYELIKMIQCIASINNELEQKNLV